MKKIHHSATCFDSSDIDSVCETLKSGFVSTGEICAGLGAGCAKVLEKSWGIPVQSGTDALTASLSLLSAGEKTKVAIPAYICGAVLDSVAHFKAIPVPVDIDPDTLCISYEKVDDLKDVEIVVGAHLFGIPGLLNRIRNKKLIEDCAQTLGIQNSDGVTVGKSGLLSVCSFYATKLLTTGHGGLLAGDDEELREAAMSLFSHDKREDWFPHLHYLMSDFNASLGLSQLQKLSSFISRRRELAKRFTYALTGSENTARSIFSRFIVIVEKGNYDALSESFERSGIDVKKPVYKPVYMLMGLDDKKFPHSKWAHDSIISIPIYPSMPEEDICRIEEFLEKNRNEMRCWPPA